MALVQAISDSGVLTPNAIREALTDGLGGRFTGQRVLVLIPDHTRSLPLPALFRMVVEILHDVRQLDFMVALGTHPRAGRGKPVQAGGHQRGRTADDLRSHWVAQSCVGRSRGVDLIGDHRPG